MHRIISFEKSLLTLGLLAVVSGFIFSTSPSISYAQSCVPNGEYSEYYSPGHPNNQFYDDDLEFVDDSRCCSGGSLTGTDTYMNNNYCWGTLPKPDIRVHTFDVRTSPLEAGSPIEFRGRVRNYSSEAPAPNSFHSRLQIDIDNNSSGWDLNIDDDGTQNGLDPLEAANRYATWSNPSAGTHQARFCADTPSNIIESNEGNNCSGAITFTVPAVQTNPDLDADRITFSDSSPDEGDNITITGYVDNIGDGDTEDAYRLRFRVDSTTIQYRNIGSHPAGTERSGDAVWTAVAGTHTIELCADRHDSAQYNDLVDESNENNNCVTRNITVAAAPTLLPDLTSQYTNVLPGGGGYTAGDSLTFRAGIRNIGDATAAGSFDVRFQLRPEGGSIANRDELDALSNLAINTTEAVNNSWTAQEGDWQVRSCADLPGTDVTESNEGNNCSSWTDFSVGAAAAAPTVSLTANPTSITEGNSSTLTWSSTNATSCTATQGAGFSTGGATSGTDAVSPAETTTYAISCTGAGGNASDTAIVTVSAAALPDLTASISGATAIGAGASFTMTGTAINDSGTAASGQFYGLFQVCNTTACSGSYDEEYRVNYPSGLASGVSSARTQSTSIASAGTYYYRYCSDKANKEDAAGNISESNENNNCAGWRTIVVSAAAQPDFTSTSGPDVEGEEGESLTFTGQIHNVGNADASGIITNLLQVCDGGCNYYDDKTVNRNGLLSGQSKDVSAAASIANEGTYYYRFCADKSARSDANGSFDESDEGNNCGSWSRITIEGDPAPTASLTANPNKISQGESTTLFWNSANATSCTGTGFSTGGFPNGSEGVSPEETSSYQVQCTGPGGSDTAFATVQVLTPEAVISVDPTRVHAGDTTTVTWSAENVPQGETCTLSSSAGSLTTTETAPANGSNVIAEDSEAIEVYQRETFTLTCPGDGDSAEVFTVVNIIPEFEEF